MLFFGIEERSKTARFDHVSGASLFKAPSTVDGDEGNEVLLPIEDENLLDEVYEEFCRMMDEDELADEAASLEPGEFFCDGNCEGCEEDCNEKN